MNENQISRVIVEAAIEVHRTLGGPCPLDLKLGLVINLGERLVKDDIQRVVNGL